MDPSKKPVEEKAQLLAKHVQRLVARHRVRLDEAKARTSDLDDPQFVWIELLTSFSTMGSSRGAEGVRQRREELSFAALTSCPKGRRVGYVERLFRAAKVRQPRRKAEWLVAAHDRIALMGGPADARAALLGCTDARQMIAWWRAFEGIGDKYSRNIMMDVYHPAFRNSVAVDARLRQVLDRLDLHLRPYPEAEVFFQRAAELANVEPWELDRVTYNFKDELLAALAGESTELDEIDVARDIVAAIRRDGLSEAVVVEVLTAHRIRPRQPAPQGQT